MTTYSPDPCNIIVQFERGSDGRDEHSAAHCTEPAVYYRIVGHYLVGLCEAHQHVAVADELYREERWAKENAKARRVSHVLAGITAGVLVLLLAFIVVWTWRT